MTSARAVARSLRPRLANRLMPRTPRHADALREGAVRASRSRTRTPPESCFGFDPIDGRERRAEFENDTVDSPERLRIYEDLFMDVRMLKAEEAETLAETFRLLGDPNRLRIILCCLDETANVGDIADVVGLSQSLVSHHLRLLRATRLLKAEKRGRQVFYSLPDCHVREMLTNLIDHIREPHEHEEKRYGSHDGEVRLR